jgi:hypothetical protein
MADEAGRWLSLFQEAQGFDTWGQLEEAKEAYERYDVYYCANHHSHSCSTPVLPPPLPR